MAGVYAQLASVVQAHGTLLTAVDRTAAVSARLANVAAERDKVRSYLDRVLASLSGRNRAKTEALLRG